MSKVQCVLDWLGFRIHYLVHFYMASEAWDVMQSDEDSRGRSLLRLGWHLLFKPMNSKGDFSVLSHCQTQDESLRPIFLSCDVSVDLVSRNRRQRIGLLLHGIQKDHKIQPLFNINTFL